MLLKIEIIGDNKNKELFDNEKKIILGKGIIINIEKNLSEIILLIVEIKKEINFNVEIMPLVLANIISSWFVYNFSSTVTLKINEQKISFKKRAIRDFVEKEIQRED